MTEIALRPARPRRIRALQALALLAGLAFAWPALPSCGRRTRWSAFGSRMRAKREEARRPGPRLRRARRLYPQVGFQGCSTRFRARALHLSPGGIVAAAARVGRSRALVVRAARGSGLSANALEAVLLTDLPPHRFAPRKMLRATVQYLRKARLHLGRSDLALEAHRLGIVYLQRVVAARGMVEPSYADLYFGSRPFRRRRLLLERARCRADDAPLPARSGRARVRSAPPGTQELVGRSPASALRVRRSSGPRTRSRAPAAARAACNPARSGAHARGDQPLPGRGGAQARPLGPGSTAVCARRRSRSCSTSAGACIRFRARSGRCS